MMITYIDRICQLVAEELANDGLEVEDSLLEFYALLALTLGEDTSWGDVHDAWAMWRSHSRPDHPALRPFYDLDPDTQELDRVYAEAIRRAAKRFLL